MADNKAQLVLDGDVSPLRQKLREAARDLKQFGDEGKSAADRIGAPLAALQSKFIAIGAVLAGGAVFRQSVSEAASFTEESIKLGNALAISATEASTFIAALADIDVSQQEFVNSAKGLLKEIKNNEDGLQAMGLVTRDAAGSLRPLNELMVDAVDVLKSYKAGTDLGLAGTALFGKGFDINGNLIKLNSKTLKENAELQKALGLIVGKDNVEAWQAYDQAMDQSTLTVKAMKTTVGNALMPVLTKLGEWFVAIGPAAIVVIKGAIGGLISAFWALKTGVSVVFNLINAAVIHVAEPIRAVGASMVKLLQGDFSGAKAEIMGIPKVWNAAWKGSFSSIVADATEARNRMLALFSDGAPAASTGAGGKSATGLLNGGAKTKARKSKANTGDQVSDAEWAMEEAAHLQRTLYEIDKQRNEYHEAANDAVLEADKKLIKEMDEIHLLRIEGAKNAEMARIDSAESMARHELEMGRITQSEYLARLGEFNQQRLEAESDLIQRKIELAKSDPTQDPVELERLEQQLADLRRQFGLKKIEVEQQQAQESESIWRALMDRVGGLWDKGVEALINGTLTWRNAMRAIGAEVVQWFATSVVNGMVKDWAIGLAKRLAALLGFTTAEKGIQIAGSAATVATKTAETTAVVGANAAQAGSGAAASQASIPIAGPILALAAMAAVFAAVSALGKKKSAMGGYDIPRGINPMVQTHEEEMILPKKYANVIRGMAAGGDGAAAEPSLPPVNVIIQAWDGGDVRRVLIDNPAALADAIRNAHRNGHR